MPLALRWLSRTGTILLTLLIPSGDRLLAQSTRPAAPPAETGWRFDATPYFWGAGLDGDVKLGRLPSSGVEASFSDLLNVLDLGLMGSFEGRKERCGFLFDAVYVKLSETQEAPDAAFGDVEAELVQEMVTLGGIYRAVEGKTTLDVVGGARYLRLDADLQLSGGVASGRTAEGGESWWDGFVGARVLFHPGERWFVMGYADLGAGGSDFTWQALAGAGYEFNQIVALKFGYRYISFDYENDDFLYDMAMAGPYVGVGFRF